MNYEAMWQDLKRYLGEWAIDPSYDKVLSLMEGIEAGFTEEQPEQPKASIACPQCRGTLKHEDGIPYCPVCGWVEILEE